MNLIIDAGNTQVKWALYSGKMQFRKGAVSTLRELSEELSGIEASETKAAIISAVRKLPGDFLSSLREKIPQIYLLDKNLPLPVKIDYDTPETLGKDRIAAAVGAAAIYPGLPVLVIDVGTAITFDLISEDASFKGGNISPGLYMRFKALNSYTDDLPLVGSSDNIPIMGRTTSEAIQSGVQLGIAYEIDAYINALVNKFNGLRVILTGGDAPLFVKNLKNTIFVVPDLVIDGLNLILNYQDELNQA